MLLFVGLGNPGFRYAFTRHNVGFMFVDTVAEEFGSSAFSYNKSVLADVLSFSYEGEKVILAKPDTYMNLSGDSLRRLSAFYKVPPQDTFVIHDDMELKFGKLKIRQNGGHSGHNGIKSIYEKWTKNFYRIRIGIDRPPPGMDPARYVLSQFSDEELRKIESEFRGVWVTIFRVIASEGIVKAMNLFNKRK